MALATQCPHCGTTFRVASDQLKLRGGIVRCGACQEIFDGNASLIDLDALAAAATASPGTQAATTPVSPNEQAASEAPASAGEAEAEQPQAGADAVHETEHTDALPDDADGEPIYTLDLAATFDPLGILPKPAAGDEDETAQMELEIEAHDEDEVHAESGPDAELGADAEPGDDTESEADVEPEANVDPEADSGTESHSEPHAYPGHAARADDQPKPIFSMGSALLEEPEPIAQDGRAEPLLDLPVDEELVATPPPGAHDEHEPALEAHADALLHAAPYAPLPMRESADVSVAATPAYGKPARSKLAGRRSKLTPTRIAPPKLRVPEIDEPEFVKRGRQREQSGRRRTILMAAGSAVLVVLLAAQAVATFRNVMAARFPAARPALAAACSVLRCRIELPAQIENLGIETGELQTLGDNTYTLTTLLHNQGSLVQAWPGIELALTDASDKPVLRRVFTPAEYLPKGVSPVAGFAARAEQPVKLSFRLDQLKPSGYRIAIFYP